MWSYFNSIKVRLEHQDEQAGRKLQTTFQFHKGTIRTNQGQSIIDFCHVFQFHKGTIRTLVSAQVRKRIYISIP